MSQEVTHRKSQSMISPETTAKLTIEKFADGAIACLKFIGTIDESFEGKKLGASTAGEVLVVDLGAVKKISSFGIREWVDFISTASKQVRSVVLIECAPKVVDQLNMVANFAGSGRVFSFYAPFKCDYCDSEHRVILQVDKDHETLKSMKLADRPCPACKEAMYFDEDGATFFSYVLGQPKFELEPAVANFLASKLNYVVSDLNRKLRIDKLIDGTTTYLRLVGDLERGFPREKLAEGLEGTVIVDLISVGRIEPAGAAEWRGFVQMASPLVDNLFLANAPPAFLEKLASKDDLGAKAQVVTLTLPYACNSCGTTQGQTIDVAEHYDVLKFATAPELRCTTCTQALQCVAGETLMALLPALPKPAASPQLVKQIGMLRERAQIAPKRPSLKVSEQQPVQAAPRASWIVPFLASLVAVVIAAGGYLAYQRFSKGDETTSAAGKIVNRSADARPAWIAADAPGTATCSDTPDKGLSCVGVSTLSARQDDADDESTDAAYEAVANAIAVRISDAKWKAAVPAIYAASRSAKLDNLDRAPDLTSARRDVREARHAVAVALRASGGSAVPATPTGRYWEELDGGAGKRFLSFAQITIGATELQKLVDAYTASASALGATVVPAFPLVAWRYPKVERGAVVTALASGPIQQAGVAEGYVVLSIGGRDVVDGPSFAKLVTDEHAELSKRGGALRFKVQTPDPAPREFVSKVAATLPEVQEGSGKRPGKGNTTKGNTGNVNVWDKYERPKGNRDDPNQ
jgi:anti-anti-sigma regulatory factor